MKDIKTKEHNRSPKILTKSSRMPKELVKKSILKTKEKAMEGADISEGSQENQTAIGYAGEKVEMFSERAAKAVGKESINASYTVGRKTMQKTYERLQKKKAEKTTKDRQGTDTADKNPVENRTNASVAEGREKLPKKEKAKAAERKRGKGSKSGEALSQKTSNAAIGQEEQPAIRTKETVKRTVKTKGGQGAVPLKEENLQASKQLSIKRSPHIIKTSATLGQGEGITAPAGKKLQMTKLAQQKTVASIRKNTARIQNSAKATVRFKRLVEAAARTVRSAITALAAGSGAMLLVLIIIVGVVGGVFSYSASQSSASLSSEVLSYTTTIQRYANQYGIPEYVSVIQAIMMQESGGRGTDPMQSSECPYNTQYPNSPGAIQDPEYSIQVGIQYYADCLREAGCDSPQDMDRLKLSLQGYNYGNGYITWALHNYGGYSEANALLFSQQQAAAHGWSSYGDPEYVAHVLRYYSGGNPFASLFGNGQIVSVALSQLGNEGGQKFWSWYGFDSYVNWCACFVSWCGDQSGLIEKGAMPKFSLCSDGMSWFQNQGKWKAVGSTPAPGSIIFFDWNLDGTSDHVGIVEKCENGRVYTVEGNSSNAVNQRNYDINDSFIMGYGIVGG